MVVFWNFNSEVQLGVSLFSTLSTPKYNYLHVHSCMLNNNNRYLKFNYSPLLLREKVCAVSPSLIISLVDSTSSPSQEGPKASDDKEHLKEFPHLLRAQSDHRRLFQREPQELLQAAYL